MAGPVQGNKGTAVGAASMTLALPGSVTAGNLLAAGMQTPNTTGATISDSINGSYTVGLNHATANAADDLAGFFKPNAASGTPTVTFTPGGTGNIGATVEEYNGPLTASPLDVTGATEANGTSITSGSLTTTGANGSLLIAWISTATKNTTLSNTTTGWTVDQNNTPNATEDAVIADRVQATSGAFTTTFSTNGAAMDMCLVVLAFKLQAAGGTAAPISARQRLVRLIAVPRGRARVAGAGPLPLAPVKLRTERLVVVTRTPRGRGQVAMPGPLPLAATVAAEKLVRLVRTPRGQGRVAGVGPAVLSPTVARERLVATVRTPRGRAKVAGSGPLALPAVVGVARVARRLVIAPRGRGMLVPALALNPIRGRTRLVKAVPIVRGRGKVAGAGPLALPPTVAMTRVAKRLVIVPRGRGVVVPALSLAPVLARTRLGRVVNTSRGHAGVAKAGPLALPATSARSQVARLRVVTPRGRAAAIAAPAVPAPVQMATRLVRILVVPRGRGRVASVAVLPGSPVIARTQLVRLVRAIFSRARMISAQLVAPPPGVRERPRGSRPTVLEASRRPAGAVAGSRSRNKVVGGRRDVS